MTPDDIKEELYRQIYSPVRWVDSINRMIEQGITLFIAIGTDDIEIVKSMVNKINRDVRVLVVKNIETLKSVAEELGE